MALKKYVVRFVRPGKSQGEPHEIQAREPVDAALGVMMDYKTYDLAKLLKQHGEVMSVVNGSGPPVYFDVETIFSEVNSRTTNMRIHNDES